jgi:hypothetical protein
MKIRSSATIAGALLAGASLGLGGTALAAGKGHGHALQLSVRAQGPVVLANGTATSKIIVKAQHGKAARKAAITLTEAATPSAGTSCGNLSASSGTTGRNGTFSVTYTASSTVGFCTITAASGSATGSATVTQIDPTLAAAKTTYTIAASAKPSSLAANGTSTSTITLTVTNGSAAVTGDAVLVSERALKAGACGALAYGAPVTDSSGQDTVTYTSSTSRGNCVLRAFEASTGANSGAIVIHQR